MERTMKVKDVMTSRVITIGPDATVRDAAKLMLDKGISGLPVVDAGGDLVGVVTEGDFLRRAEIGTGKKRSLWQDILLGPGRLAEEYVQSHGRHIKDVMTPKPYTTVQDASLEDVVALMEKRAIKRVPVVENGKIVGIVSRSNLIRALISAGPSISAGSVDDATIRARIAEELNRERWASLGTTEVIVRNGTVHLWGIITDERERQALIVAAQNVPGVKEVRDHLSWMEPTSGVVIPPEDDTPKSAIV
jgi:CBS domain-containing protein